MSMDQHQPTDQRHPQWSCAEDGLRMLEEYANSGAPDSPSGEMTLKLSPYEYYQLMKRFEERNQHTAIYAQNHIRYVLCKPFFFFFFFTALE